MNRAWASAYARGWPPGNCGGGQRVAKGAPGLSLLLPSSAAPQKGGTPGHRRFRGKRLSVAAAAHQLRERGFIRGGAARCAVVEADHAQGGRPGVAPPPLHRHVARLRQRQLQHQRARVVGDAAHDIQAARGARHKQLLLHRRPSFPSAQPCVLLLGGSRFERRTQGEPQPPGQQWLPLQQSRPHMMRKPGAARGAGLTSRQKRLRAAWRSGRSAAAPLGGASSASSACRNT